LKMFAMLLLAPALYAAPDWSRLDKAALDLLREGAGIPVRLYSSGPAGQTNLVARLLEISHLRCNLCKLVGQASPAARLVGHARHSRLLAGNENEFFTPSSPRIKRVTKTYVAQEIPEFLSVGFGDVIFIERGFHQRQAIVSQEICWNCRLEGVVSGSIDRLAPN